MSNRAYAFGCSILLAALMLSLGGCQALGIAMDRAGGEKTVKAQYVPVQKDAMLVLVESYGLALDSVIEEQHLQTVLRKSIRDQKIAPVVGSDELEKIHDANPLLYQKMTITELGRAVGARQVLYVQIDRAEIVHPSGGDQIRGEMDAILKIVDTETGDNRWPAADTMPASIKTSWVNDQNTTPSELGARMADELGENIVHFFHDWHPDNQTVEKMGSEAQSE